MVSDERIEEIRARAEAATPAPWADDNGYRVRFGGNKIVCDMKLFDGVGNDSAFVAHARTDVPDLLDALAAARAEVAALRAGISDALALYDRWYRSDSQVAVSHIAQALTGLLAPEPQGSAGGAGRGSRDES